MRLAKKQVAVRNAMLGISWFWFFGTVLTAQLPSYAPLHLGGDETLYILALAPGALENSGQQDVLA